MARTTRHSASAYRAGDRYRPPDSQQIKSIKLSELLRFCGRNGLQSDQLDLLRRDETPSGRDVSINYVGNLDLLKAPCVSIVGTREVTERGRLRAARLAHELVSAGVVIVSGLARGVDTSAHTSAIENAGSTVAVIGTPIDKASPVENARLQEQIYKEHLLISPFEIGAPVFKSNFPERNRIMAALSDATVIIEASDTSGTLYQAVACQRLGRWLFILKSVVENTNVTWPARFLGQPKTAILEKTDDLLATLWQPLAFDEGSLHLRLLF